MMPAPHRRKSSKESPARHYNSSEGTGFLYSGILGIASEAPPRRIFPTSDRYLAYGYQSRHSGGAAISR